MLGWSGLGKRWDIYLTLHTDDEVRETLGRAASSS